MCLCNQNAMIRKSFYMLGLSVVAVSFIKSFLRQWKISLNSSYIFINQISFVPKRHIIDNARFPLQCSGEMRVRIMLFLLSWTWIKFLIVWNGCFSRRLCLKCAWMKNWVRRILSCLSNVNFFIKPNSVFLAM